MSKTYKGRGDGQWIRTSTRLAIYHRDGFACAFCGAGAEEGQELTLDHLHPCELGGTNDPTNLVTACRSCNCSKQDSTMRQWFATLRDYGVCTKGLSAKLKRMVARPLDRAEGRRLAKARTR